MSSLRVGTITVIGRDKSGVVAKVTHCLFVQVPDTRPGRAGDLEGNSA